MIHQYKLNGYNIVLDDYSGSVHVVDDVAYDIIGMYEGHTKEEITKEILEKYADNPEVTEPPETEPPVETTAAPETEAPQPTEAPTVTEVPAE